mmetsp:Transcript_19885/g.50647  ORF Transcript_19885/g.50647 Transcript_19885/m.50647 type:complete len:207 (+) Transcript_19885:301-921(+)
MSLGQARVRPLEEWEPVIPRRLSAAIPTAHRPPHHPYRRPVLPLLAGEQAIPSKPLHADCGCTAPPYPQCTAAANNAFRLAPPLRGEKTNAKKWPSPRRSVQVLSARVHSQRLTIGAKPHTGSRAGGPRPRSGLPLRGLHCAIARQAQREVRARARAVPPSPLSPPSRIASPQPQQRLLIEQRRRHEQSPRVPRSARWRLGEMRWP